MHRHHSVSRFRRRLLRFSPSLRFSPPPPSSSPRSLSRCSLFSRFCFSTNRFCFPPSSRPPPLSPRHRFSKSPVVAADPTAAFIPSNNSARISSVTGHRRAPAVVCKKNTPVSYELTLCRSLGDRICCAPSQYPCALAGTINASPRLNALFSSAVHIGTSLHAGTTTTNDSLESLSSAVRSNFSARSAAARSTSGTNGGFISNDPRVGAKSKNDPRDPNGPSTSGNALQNRPYRAFSGDANASHPTPTRFFKTSNAFSPSAA
eukprot:30980-Pelagococcus_subviridis.AAC.23